MRRTLYANVLTMALLSAIANSVNLTTTTDDSSELVIGAGYDDSMMTTMAA